MLPCLIGLIIWTFVSAGCTKRHANELIDRVEAFKQKDNRLPYSVEELGLPTGFWGGYDTDGCGCFEVDYELNSDSTGYIISYGVGLGESMIYNSIDKKWKHLRG